MRSSSGKSAILVLAAALAGCASDDAQNALEARVDAAMEPYVALGEFSGAIVLAREGEFVYQRGFGMANHAGQVPFTPDTPADGGSLAKTLTAAGIWQLAYEDRIDPDAPVTTYLREFPHASTTVRHLVSHTNGLPPSYDFWDPYFAPDEVRTAQAMLGIVARERPQPSFTPGSRFEYSNFGFDVAALLIERVTGLAISEFYRQRFFSRFGMNTTFARPARFADWPGVRTMGYRWQDGAWEAFDVYDMEAFIGASNVYFSVNDLSRWASANAAGRAVAPGALAAGQARAPIGGHPSPITGLSWYCDDSGLRCYYTGSINAFHGFAYWDRERNESVAFIANSSMPPWRTVTLERELVAALAGREAQPEPSIEFLPIDRTARAAITGQWTTGEARVLTIADGGVRPTLRVGDGLEFDMFQVGSEVFYVPGPDYWIAFSGDGPAAMHVRSVFADFIARRAP
ncbi:MAG: serine hydrolase domain-containing protein [Gammaproteobacteria bacterium]